MTENSLSINGKESVLKKSNNVEYENIKEASIAGFSGNLVDNFVVSKAYYNCDFKIVWFYCQFI